jgi:Domain of unknown function (4846)
MAMMSIIWLLSVASSATPQALAETVAQAFPPPDAAVRRATDAWGAHVQALPLRSADAPITTYNGGTVAHDAHVVDLPLVKGDLQQCADSILRLRAEWLRDQGLPVSFHATSGDLMPWSRYQAGERAAAVGRGLQWSGGRDPASWDQYLSALFTWAGTRSLQAHDTKATTELQAGTVLVRGGSPGHAVLVLDVADGPDGTWLLVGEGFMPAQDFHVERGPNNGWWPWSPGLDLPHWSFAAVDLRRF